MKQQNPQNTMAVQAQSTQNPVYCDIVVAHATVQDNAKKEARFKRAGNVRLIFIDSLTKRAVADVVLSPITLESMTKVLKDTADQLDKLMKGEKLPQIPAEPQITEPTTYVG